MPQPGRTYSAKPSEITSTWYVIDARGQTLGRLAANLAKLLRGERTQEERRGAGAPLLRRGGEYRERQGAAAILWAADAGDGLRRPTAADRDPEAFQYQRQGGWGWYVRPGRSRAARHRPRAG